MDQMLVDEDHGSVLGRNSRVRTGQFQSGDCETCRGAEESLGEVGSSASVFYIL